MAFKTKKNKRSLATLKRTEPSRKEMQNIAFARSLLNGEVDLDAMADENPISDEVLAQYPKFDDLVAEAKASFGDDVSKDADELDKFLNKHADHPQILRLQMTLMRALAERMTDDEKESFIKNVCKNKVSLLDDDEPLDNKIMETASLFDMGRKSKALKNITACIRRIEDKHIPADIDGVPVYSLAGKLNAFLYQAEQAKAQRSGEFYQAPASFDVAYHVLARLLLEDDNYVDAQKAAQNAVRWNPVNVDMLLLDARIHYYFEDLDAHKAGIEAAYPLIHDREALSEYYMEWAARFDHDDDFESAVRVLRLANHVHENISAQALIDTFEQDELEHTVEPISREALLAFLKEKGIAFGASAQALECLRKAANAIEKDDPEYAQHQREEADYLSTCLDDIESL